LREANFKSDMQKSSVFEETYTNYLAQIAKLDF